MGYLFLSSWICLHFNTANLTWVLTFSSIPLPLLNNRDAPLNTPIFHPLGRTTFSRTNLDSHVQSIGTSVLSLLCLVESALRFYKWCWAQENHLMLVGTLFYLQAAAHGVLHNRVSCPRMEYLSLLAMEVTAWNTHFFFSAVLVNCLTTVSPLSKDVCLVLSYMHMQPIHNLPRLATSALGTASFRLLLQSRLQSYLYCNSV